MPLEKLAPNPLHELFEGFAYRLEKKFPRLDRDIVETVHTYAPSCSLDEVILMLPVDPETLTEQELRDIKQCHMVVRLKAINVAIKSLGDSCPELYLDWIKMTESKESPIDKAHSFEQLLERAKANRGKGEENG